MTKMAYTLSSIVIVNIVCILLPTTSTVQLSVAVGPSDSLTSTSTETIEDSTTDLNLNPLFDACAAVGEANYQIFFSELWNITTPGDFNASLTDILYRQAVGYYSVGVYEGRVENGVVIFEQCTVVESTSDNPEDVYQVIVNKSGTDAEAIFTTKVPYETGVGATIELFANVPQQSSYNFRLLLINNIFNGSLPLDPCSNLEQLKLQIVIDAFANQVREADSKLFIVNLPVLNTTTPYGVLLEQCVTQIK